MPDIPQPMTPSECDFDDYAQWASHEQWRRDMAWFVAVLRRQAAVSNLLLADEVERACSGGDC